MPRPECPFLRIVLKSLPVRQRTIVIERMVDYVMAAAQVTEPGATENLACKECRLGTTPCE